MTEPAPIGGLPAGTGATDFDNYLAALKMVKMQGGVFGAVAPSRALHEALAAVSAAQVA